MYDAFLKTQGVNMFGAIIGDIVGSRFEFEPNRSKEFELLTGDGFKENPTIEEFQHIQDLQMILL